jgi:hypothetical protein
MSVGAEKAADEAAEVPELSAAAGGGGGGGGLPAPVFCAGGGGGGPLVGGVVLVGTGGGAPFGGNGGWSLVGVSRDGGGGNFTSPALTMVFIINFAVLASFNSL